MSYIIFVYGSYIHLQMVIEHPLLNTGLGTGNELVRKKRYSPKFCLHGVYILVCVQWAGRDQKKVKCRLTYVSEPGFKSGSAILRH